MSIEFDPKELIYNKDSERNIYSGGYNISTLISENEKDVNNFGDIFKDLVVPNLFFSSPMIDMGKYQKGGYINKNIELNGSNTINDDLVDKLIAIASSNKEVDMDDDDVNSVVEKNNKEISKNKKHKMKNIMNSKKKIQNKNIKNTRKKKSTFLK